jgi:asparagine synthase (glutamine-hydrolysing)
LTYVGAWPYQGPRGRFRKTNCWLAEKRHECIKAENPQAAPNSREAAYYFKIFRQLHPQDPVLGSIGIRTGSDFAEEREQVRGTVDGDLKHVREEDEETSKVG